MPLYVCPRCGYKCGQRNDMRKHFNRKNRCRHIAENVSVKECFNRILNEKPSPIKKKGGDVCKTCPVIITTTDNSSDSDIGNEDNNYACEYCDKTFKHHQSYYRHKKGRCDEKEGYTRKELELKTIIDSRDQTIVDLSVQIEKLLDRVVTTNHTTNNTFNFVVNAFGQEDTSYIPSKFIMNLMKSAPYDSIPKLLKEIHFHPEHSENLNVKIPNKKLQTALIFNGVTWEYKDRRETIENMTDKAYGILNKHYDQSDDNNYMDQFKSDFESGNKETLKKIKDKTELTILNNQSSITKVD